VLWLWPAGVVVAFRCPFEDLAFDDAGVGSLSPRGVEVFAEPVDCATPDRV
jgi:hypothetical protein